MCIFVLCLIVVELPRVKTHLQFNQIIIIIIIIIVGMEWGPLSLVSTIKELLGEKVAAPV
jgi:hypothetical protein